MEVIRLPAIHEDEKNMAKRTSAAEADRTQRWLKKGELTDDSAYRHYRHSSRGKLEFRSPGGVKSQACAKARKQLPNGIGC